MSVSNSSRGQDVLEEGVAVDVEVGGELREEGRVVRLVVSGGGWVTVPESIDKIIIATWRLGEVGVVHVWIVGV